MFKAFPTIVLLPELESPQLTDLSVRGKFELQRPAAGGGIGVAGVKGWPRVSEVGLKMSSVS